MASKLKQDISIGVNLKKYRLATGMSQEIVAAKLQTQGLDIHRKIISQMELGEYSIRVSVLLALSDLYQRPVQDFFVDLERFEPSNNLNSL
jgi:transcriptional regulator with XRE-family HTH domain